MALILAPLPIGELSPAVARILAGAAPMKLMAARGIAPLRPSELAVTLFQLAFDSDESVSKAAAAGPAQLPDPIVLAPLREALPPLVLHWFADRLPLQRTAAIEAVLLNSATADDTCVLLAGRAVHERAMDILFENEQRLLRCPAILEALYQNQRAPMAALNRAIELCARNGVRLDAIPAYEEVARSIGQDPGSKDDTGGAAFDAIMRVAAEEQAPSEGSAHLEVTRAIAEEPQSVPTVQADAEAAAEPAAGSTSVESNPPADEAQPEQKKRTVAIDYSKLKLHEKIRLATLGNYGVRRNLLRDSNKLVALATIRSPRITEAEVIQAAGNKALCDDVIRYIASQKSYMRLYSVKLSLVNNPKCPLTTSMKLIPFLRIEDLRDLAKSKGVPSALVIAAKKMLATRSKT